MNRFKALIIATFSLLLAGTMLCAPVVNAAPLAANTQIINTAVVTYAESSVAISATVTVTIALIPTLPTMTPVDAITNYNGPTSELVTAYIVTANSNGPETYSLNTIIQNANNTTAPSLSAPGTLTLGASVTLAGSTTSIIQLPADGLADDSVNGLEVGDTITINNELRTITAINDTVSGSADLTLDSPLTVAPEAGVAIAEQKIITATVTSGPIQTVGTDITIVIGTEIIGTAGTTPTATAKATFTSNVTNLEKYARNVTRLEANALASGQRSFTINGQTIDYYLTNVTAAQGDRIEYLLFFQSSGNGSSDDCVIVDHLPSGLVTFATESYGKNDKDILALATFTTEEYFTRFADNDRATLNGSVLTIYVGSGATNVKGGRLNGGESIAITYQVSIDN